MMKLNRSIPAGLLVVLVAALVLMFVSRIDRGLAVFWFFGLAFGFVLQRSRFCFASAFRDLVWPVSNVALWALSPLLGRS